MDVEEAKTKENLEVKIAEVLRILMIREKIQKKSFV